jgi:hypothetical protein
VYGTIKKWWGRDPTVPTVRYASAKNCFFSSLNAILSKICRSASEEVILSLVRSKCLPYLLYGTEAIRLAKHDMNSLDFTLTRFFMKLFRTGSTDIVNECQVHFNFLPVRYLIDIRTTRFLQKFITSSNHICMLFFNNAVNIVNNLFSFYHVTSLYDMCNSINEQFYSRS